MSDWSVAPDLRDQLQNTLGDAYSIEHELGGGGMSRLFSGTDVRLGRQIVVKILPPDFRNAVSIERFKREIQVAACLQHPHVVPVLMAGEVEGLPFYMMPFVKGESLRTRLTRGGELSVTDTLHILRDVATALAYAHQEGIVHRDIKPENVLLSGNVAVVTDFGVAKAVHAATAPAASESILTTAGVAVGTTAYMAPEQAAGDPHVDHRADIYAFGCMAYEMLTGASPFGGRSAQQQLAAHITETPTPLGHFRPSVPEPLGALVMECLEKRAGDRPQSADRVVASIDAIASTGATGGQASRRFATTRRRVPLFGVAAGVLALALMALWRSRSAFTPFTVVTTSPLTATPELEMDPALSPDGTLVAYAAETPRGSRIFVRRIDGGRAVELTPDLDGDHRWPRWSPDQSRLVFMANDAVFIVPALGGVPRRVIESSQGPVVTPAWSPDGTQLAYADGRGIAVRSLDGGPERTVVAGVSLHSPSWSPNGSRLAYAEGLRPALHNISTNTIRIVPVAGGTPRPLSDSTHVNVSPVWAPDGTSVLYVSNRGGALDVYEQAVGPDGSPVGTPHRVTTMLNTHTITLSASGARMAHDVVQNRTTIWMVPIVPGPVARTSSAIRITDGKESIEGLSLSRDGHWLAYDSNIQGNFDIHKRRADGTQAMQLTVDRANDFIPAWSPDGREIAFHSTRNGTRDIYVVNAEGGAETQVTSGPREDFAPSWSPDGRSLVFRGFSAGIHRAYVVTRDAGGRWSDPRVATPDSVRALWVNAVWSPDGSLIAFMNRGIVAVVNAADSAAVRILADSGALGGALASLTWGRDPARLYVTVQSDSSTNVIAASLTGVRFDTILVGDARHRMRPEIATDDRRLFFTLGVWDSDVWVLDLRRGSRKAGGRNP